MNRPSEAGIFRTACLRIDRAVLPKGSFPRIPSGYAKRLLGVSVRLGILMIAAAVAVLFMLRWDSWVGARVDQSTDDAYVKGDLTPLSGKVEGYVRKVPVNDFERVKAGELLLEIEDDDY
ncbi:MAG: hypothetical protein JO339_15270, partial [Alphaproteobacteria bacterium]|nr:hypothetical protein [Alphaproteobacteria bacterium]